MFIGRADPDLGVGRTHNFFDPSYRLAVLAKGALGAGEPGGPPQGTQGV